MQFDLHISFQEDVIEKDSTSSSYLFIRIIPSWWEQLPQLGPAVPRAGTAGAGGRGSVAPSCCTPGWVMPQAVSDTGLGSAGSQAQMRSKAVSLLHSVCAHLRLPQLPPSSRSTELLMLKNRFFPQIWPWCGGLMENPSSCCCKTPFP